MKLNEQIKQGLACNSIKKPHSLLAQAVCFSVHPGKMILFPFKHWFNQRYKGRYKYQKLIFSIDLILIGVIVAIGSIALFFLLNPPKSFADDIHFEATVAPREIVAGGSSTLVIRFTNNTEEELRKANLSFEYPNHFLLQEISAPEATINENIVYLDSVPVGGSGTVRIRGVMFGDVGGEQIFKSTMNFVHGSEKDLAGQKISAHIFSPVSSTLILSLNLPERLIAYQPIKGSIKYKNTGEVDFPVISIEPEWPAGFRLLKHSAKLVQGALEVPAVKAGEEGVMTFEGTLGDTGETAEFIFHPSFSFDQTRYKQETLRHLAPVIPPQITVSHSAEKKTLRPGSNALFTVTYKNIGEFKLIDVEIGIESESPFFQKDLFTVTSKQYPELKELNPGDSGEVSVSVPLRSSISQSETSEYENLKLITRAKSIYTFSDGSNQKVSSNGKDLSTPLTTPLVLESFARYTTQSGDQIGRGPLPPRAGKETRYWIFWHIGSTTNEISNVLVDGILPENVEFTGKQTVSQNSGVVFDSKTRTVSWTAKTLPPTLSPNSKIIGIAFEVAITPTIEQIDTEPFLMKDIQITATDSQTGAFLSTFSKDISTYILDDKMASQKSAVKP